MITPVTSSPPSKVRQQETSSKPQTASPGPEKGHASEAPSTKGLAASIMADGGLGFLQSRLLEKLEGVFAAAAEINPDLAAAGPASFFSAEIDVSPEATADRIVSFALGLRGVYARQNEDLSDEEMMPGFEQEIRRGVSEGFDHARGALTGLELLEGDIQTNVDLTWDLVQQKLDNYFHPEISEAT